MDRQHVHDSPGRGQLRTVEDGHGPAMAQAACGGLEGHEQVDLVLVPSGLVPVERDVHHLHVAGLQPRGLQPRHGHQFAHGVVFVSQARAAPLRRVGMAGAGQHLVGPQRDVEYPHDPQRQSLVAGADHFVERERGRRDAPFTQRLQRCRRRAGAQCLHGSLFPPIQAAGQLQRRITGPRVVGHP